jgi:hypothetical protein
VYPDPLEPAGLLINTTLMRHQRQALLRRYALFHADSVLTTLRAVSARARRLCVPSSALSMASWSVKDIPFADIDPRTVENDDILFYVLASASMVESGSDTYTRNLVAYYGDNDDLARWLALQWEPEELQHGSALRAYVEHVWPDFDWDTAYRTFFADYAQRCTLDELEPTQGLELAARCVVEMGTASLYRSLQAYANEPVLRTLMDNIRSDEVRHYKYFYRYFRDYNARERNGRRAVFGALLRRLMEIRNDDADCAIRHVMAVREPQADAARLADVSRRTRLLIRRNLPVDMSVKMLLKPLDLPPRMQAGIEYPLNRLTRYLFLR